LQKHDAENGDGQIRYLLHLNLRLLISSRAVCRFLLTTSERKTGLI
jgi:hypothetical protein